MAGLNTHELAWAAGLLEGEGCWYVTPKGNSRSGYPRITYSQVHRYVLDRLRAATNLGKVYGPRRLASRPTHKPHYEYCVWGFENVQAITAALWSFLGPVKRKQAKRVLRAARKKGK